MAAACKFSWKIAGMKALRGGLLTMAMLALYYSDFAGLTDHLQEPWKALAVTVVGAVVPWLRNICKQKLTATLGGLL